MSIEITEFISELALLLESNISCRDALKIVQQEQEQPAIRRLIGAIYTDVDNGISLADSWAKHPLYFEPFLVELLREGGEQNQAATLTKIAQYLESLEVSATKLTEKVFFSSIYVLALFFVLFILMMFLFTYVVPVFADMFGSFGGELPRLTQLIVNIADFWTANGIVIIVVALLLGGLIWFKWRSVTLYMPLFGRLYHKIALVHFLRTFAFMLSNEKSLVAALEASAQMVNNTIYAKKLQQVSQQVAEGENLSEALKAHSFFPTKIIHAALVGIQTGKLAQLFSKLAELYTKQLSQLTEPYIKAYALFFLILIGMLVGFLIVSMYLPLFLMGAQI